MNSSWQLSLLDHGKSGSKGTHVSSTPPPLFQSWKHEFLEEAHMQGNRMSVPKKSIFSNFLTCIDLCFFSLYSWMVLYFFIYYNDIAQWGPPLLFSASKKTWALPPVIIEMDLFGCARHGSKRRLWLAS
jgi:hypothetical protein